MARHVVRLLNVLQSVVIVGSAMAGSPTASRTLLLQGSPTTSVESVAVSPDGTLVATGAGEGGIRLYDAKTGAFLKAIADAGDRGVAFSADGKTLTAAGFHMDKLVRLYDVRSGDRKRALAGHTEWEAYATALSPDGKLLASTGMDQQILVWELSTGNLRLQLKQPARIAALAFSPDSQLLACGGSDKTVRLLNVTDGKTSRTLSGHRDAVVTLSFSPDDKWLASGCCDWNFHRGHDWPRPIWKGAEKYEWKLWEVSSGKPLRTVGDKGQLLSLGISPDGKWLACGIDKELRIYDLPGDEPAQVLTSHDGNITSVAFTPDSAAVVSSSHDHAVKCTDLATRQLRWRAPGYFEQVNSVALSEDASLLVSGSSDPRFAHDRLRADAPYIGPGATRVWDLHSGRMLRRLGDDSQQVMAVAISADGALAASGGANQAGAGTVNVWETATGKLHWGTQDQELEVLAVAFSPNHALLATASADGAVVLRETKSGRATRSFTAHQGGATSLAFTPDGKLLVAGDGKGSVYAWEIASGQTARTFQVAGGLPRSIASDRLMNSIGVSRDGATLATCNSSMNMQFPEFLKIWDLRTGALRRDFSAEKIAGRPMALSPDGSMVATGGKTVRLWEVQTGKLLRELVGYLKRTQSIAFSSDGRLVIAGGSYGTINLWDVKTGKHLAILFAFTVNREQRAADDWLCYTPEGFYECSPESQKYLAWRIGDEFVASDAAKAELNQPARVTAALANLSQAGTAK